MQSTIAPMNKYALTAVFLGSLQFVSGQAINNRLQKAIHHLRSDSQLKHGSIGITVLDAKTGKNIFSVNEQTGLAPASCQKILTSIAAFELMGKNFRYRTDLGYAGSLDAGTLQGDLQVTGSGDPTLGSWRWKETGKESVLAEFVAAVRDAGIKHVTGRILINDANFSIQAIPGGWVWDDIGNYYGAGTWSVNWGENQYDLFLQAGSKIGEPTKIESIKPSLGGISIYNQIKTGIKGSGDNGYIYLPIYAREGFTEGTIPLGEDHFVISGSTPYAPAAFGQSLQEALGESQIYCGQEVETTLSLSRKGISWSNPNVQLYTHYSPSLDSLNFWFLKKSINLYGEALVKTIAYEKTGNGNTAKGVELVRGFWKGQGIEASSINIMDGSGLSPQNRVTTAALVKALLYAQSRQWYPSFFSALPLINGMHMKSGSIGGSRSFAGYQKSAHGQEYVFAMIVNNFDGDAGDIIKKMWEVLDLLK